MAAELTQDAVLHFLQSRGGTVTNAELLLHFRPFLREHADRERNRQLFKKFVNSVARVKQEDGVSYVVLQRRFRGHVHDVSAGVSGVSRGDSPGVSRGDVFLSPPWTTDKHRNKSAEVGLDHQGPITTPVLPAAGIVLNNNSSAEPKLNLPQCKVQQSPAQGAFMGHTWHPEEPASTPQPLPAPPQGYTGHPEGPARTQRETLKNGASAKAAQVTLQEPRQPNLPPEHVPAQVLSHPAQQLDSFPRTSASQVSPVCEAPISQGQTTSKPQQQENSAKPVRWDVSVVPSQLGQKHSLQSTAPQRVRLRQSYRSAVSVDEDEEEEEVVSVRRGSAQLEAAGVWDLKATVGLLGRAMSQSSPSLEGTAPQIQLQDPEGRGGRSLEEHHMTSERGLWAPPPPQPQKVSPARTIPQIHIQDLDPDCRRGSESAYVTPEQRFRTPSPARSQNVCGSSSSLEQSQRSRMSSGWSTCEELSQSGGSGGGAQVGTPQSESSWQQSAEELISGDIRRRPWHHSTGDLCDDEAEKSDGSTSSLVIRMRPAVTRRLSSNLRNRMCLSMGADLDQLLQDEDKRALGGSEAARLHRLQLISSSLSLRHMSSSSLSSCSTSPRFHSLADLTDKDHKIGRKSLPSTTHQQEGPSRQYQIPLEEREHLWLVKAAAGAWPDIYSLFREDPSLLQRRDFISGFTVLHWIAKHGDHRVLNTLWYGVEKAGLTFDTNAQSLCGYTPLHIAAMHSRKNIIRLLVNKFQANVSLRDAAGRKAWFYLPCGAPTDIFQLLGAPPKVALGQAKVGQQWASPPTQPQPQKRSRRHHFSSASGDRPLTLAGGTKVKRSSSLAAFLKHKSLQKVQAHSEWGI